MVSIASRLQRLLERYGGRGRFLRVRRHRIPALRLEVDGFVVVALPLLPTPAEQLIASPRARRWSRRRYFRRYQCSARRQIGADRVAIGCQALGCGPGGMVARAAEGSG